jgi:hypothetical protein
VVVFMENHGSAAILGNPCCPYETRLAAQGTTFTHFYGVAYPSKSTVRLDTEVMD